MLAFSFCIMIIGASLLTLAFINTLEERDKKLKFPLYKTKLAYKLLIILEGFLGIIIIIISLIGSILFRG